MAVSVCHAPSFFSMTFQTEIISIETSAFLKQTIFPKSFNSVLYYINFQLQFAKDACEPVRDTTGLWADCADLVDFTSYYHRCISDACAVNTLNVYEPSCVILAVVARDCALHGAVIDDWKHHTTIDGVCGMCINITKVSL